MDASISPAAAKKLLAGKSVMLRGLVRRDGTKVDRLVELDRENGWRVRIAADQSVKVGTCPKCGCAVMDVGNERAPYLCERNVRPRGEEAVEAPGGQDGQGGCDFRLFRDYLGKRLSKADVSALLAGKTVTLKGLTSKKTGDKFNAYAMLDPESDFRLRICGYPAEQPKKKEPKAAKPAAEKKPKVPGGPDQATLPGFDW